MRQLNSPVEQERVDAAQALPFFVSQADDPAGATRTALTALSSALADGSVNVRRAVANSLAGLVLDATDIPDGFATMVSPAPGDEDQVVRSRIAEVLKRIAKQECVSGVPQRRTRKSRAE